MDHWLDKYIEEQRKQRELMDRITAPYTAVELQEYMTEDKEQELFCPWHGEEEKREEDERDEAERDDLFQLLEDRDREN